MAKAKKLPSGRWRVQPCKVIDGKKTRYSIVADTKREAELLAAEWVCNNTPKNNPAGLTVAEAIDEYVKLKDGVLSPSTIRGYVNIRKNSIEPIADIKLPDLTTNRMQAFINDIAKSKSAKTVYNVYGLIASVMRQFAPQYQFDRITLPQRQKPETQALSGKEIAMFINAVDGHRNEIPFLLAVWLGLRQSEILGLMWEDVSFKSNTIYIHRAKVPNAQNKYVLKDCTKNKSSTRVLPLPSYISDKMKAVADKEGHVVQASASLLFKDLQKVCASIGLEHIGLHDLRRSMATLGVTLNIADKAMMARGGWSNPQTMKNIYQQALEGDRDRAAVAIDDYIMEQLQESALKSAHEKN